MTNTLFLSDHLSGISRGGTTFTRGETIFKRNGGLRSDAVERLSALGTSGDTVALLPASATSCQTYSVSARIGRQLGHSDMADAMQAALAQAGDGKTAVVAAEPSRILLDGQSPDGTPVGKPCDSLEVDVTVFVSPLSTLSDLEATCNASGLELGGVLAMEEAAAAALSLTEESPKTVVFFDRWHTKVMELGDNVVRRSVTVPAGPGHIADDLAVTFDMTPEKAEETARRILLGNARPTEEERLPVVDARLEELIRKTRQAMAEAKIDHQRALLIGLAASPGVLASFAQEGITAEPPAKELTRTDPAIFALAAGAAKLASGAVPRSATTALQLSAPREARGPLAWLRRNF